ncbi:hypothetical protein QYF36_010959 [Acer negundo]|nr:hypothetical protein QYF36_010959 [Acer negundo]
MYMVFQLSNSVLFAISELPDNNIMGKTRTRRQNLLKKKGKQEENHNQLANLPEHMDLFDHTGSPCLVIAFVSGCKHEACGAGLGFDPSTKQCIYVMMVSALRYSL